MSLVAETVKFLDGPFKKPLNEAYWGQDWNGRGKPEVGMKVWVTDKSKGNPIHRAEGYVTKVKGKKYEFTYYVGSNDKPISKWYKEEDIYGVRNQVIKPGEKDYPKDGDVRGKQDKADVKRIKSQHKSNMRRAGIR